MVSEDVVYKARVSMKIEGRYDRQEIRRVGGKLENIRKIWTPAQVRRMNKKRTKNGLVRRDSYGKFVKEN